MCLEICAIELLSRTIYQPPFLLYAAPCTHCLAIVAASQWPRELRLLKRFLITGVAQVQKESSQVRTSNTVFSQATSGSLEAVEVRAMDTGILYGFGMMAQYLFRFASASLTFLSPT